MPTTDPILSAIRAESATTAEERADIATNLLIRAIEDHAKDRVMLVAEIDRVRAEREVIEAEHAASQARWISGAKGQLDDFNEMRAERDAWHADAVRSAAVARDDSDAIAKLKARVADLEALVPSVTPEPEVQPPDVDSHEVLIADLIRWGEARARDRRADARLNEFRDRAAKLEARPALTLDALGIALAATERDGRALGDIAADVMAKLGPVTLPAQDRAQDLTDAIEERLLALGLGGFGQFLAPDDRCKLVESALASLGAPAASPRPADVFAGATIKELGRVACDADEDYFAPDDGPSDPWPTIAQAVLDALRVRLVAPVDPEAVARDYMERVVPGLYDACKSPSLHFSSMRLTLEAANIPVTPEAGK